MKTSSSVFHWIIHRLNVTVLSLCDILIPLLTNYKNNRS
jgi:hypothetical protein